MPYRQTERSERVRRAAREKILRAARKLFVQRGFDATTMQDIVQAAGTSIGNLYFYFPNKEELLGTLAEAALRAAWARGDAVMDAVPPGAGRLAVMVFANAYGLMVLDRELIRILLEADRLLAVRTRIIDLNMDRVRAIVRANVPDYPERDVDLAVVAWTGATRYMIEQGTREGRLNASVAAIAEFVTRWNLRGLGVREAEIDKAIAVAQRLLRRELGGVGTSL